MANTSCLTMYFDSHISPTHYDAVIAVFDVDSNQVLHQQSHFSYCKNVVVDRKGSLARVNMATMRMRVRLGLGLGLGSSPIARLARVNMATAAEVDSS